MEIKRTVLAGFGEGSPEGGGLGCLSEGASLARALGISRASLACLTHKSIPYAVRREEMGGIRWISFEFLPEVQNMVVDCPHRGIVAVT